MTMHLKSFGLNRDSLSDPVLPRDGTLATMTSAFGEAVLDPCSMSTRC